MAIKLSNGKVLSETGQRDARGLPILRDAQGNLYTNNNGKINLSRPITSQGADILSYLTGAGQEDLFPAINLTDERLQEAFKSADSFEFPELSSFRDKAEDEIGTFFDKDFEFLEKTINQAKRQQTEKTDMSKKRLEEDEALFFKTEDKDFARALTAAQQGFTGRGTVNSGFRREAIQEKIDDREQGLEGAEQQFDRAGQDIDLDFKNFMDDLTLTEEGKRLDLDRAKESSIIAQQQNLQTQEMNRRLAKQSQAQDFIREKLGA